MKADPLDHHPGPTPVRRLTLLIPSEGTVTMRRSPVVTHLHRPRAAAFVLLALAAAAATAQSALPAEELSEQARTQLRTIYAEKASRTPAQKKLSTQLVYAVRELAGDPAMIGIPRLNDPRVEQARIQGLSLEVDMTAEVSETLLQEIRSLGGRIVNAFAEYRTIRAFLPLSAIEPLAERGDVTRIREAAQPITNKINTSQGDVAHRANVARSISGVNGSGVKVGVLSDSIDALASLQASGDLPAVNVISGQSGNPGSSEGTAMLEIVHDLAPGAQLWFATGGGGEPNCANNIAQLAAAGCKVIVDDIGYATEHPFQDDIVAQAVNTVIGQGVSYFSSAGNEGNLSSTKSGTWEGDFSSGAAIDGWPSHNFTAGANLNGIVSIGAPNPVLFLWWSDANGSSANDYDLCLVDATATTILTCSADSQDGNDDPLEAVPLDATAVGGYVLILKDPAAQPRFLNLTNRRGRLGVATSGQTRGHSAAAGAFSVAAVDVASAAGGAFVGGGANPVESFSSDGPRRIFYNANGTPITPGNYLSSGGTLRQKPDIAAADGVATATSSAFNPFFGTSAAAPHAAAIAALMLQAKPGATPAEVRQAFASTSLDIMAPGVDRDSGYGIVDAAAAVEAIAGGSGNTDPCVRDSQTACLLSNRFEVRVSYTTASASGNAQLMSFNGARAESDQSAFYYFFDNANFEMGVKMQNACVAPFNKYWVFVSGLTNQGYTVTVRDSNTGATKSYSNPLGSYPQSVGDTSALNCLLAPPGDGDAEILGILPVGSLSPAEELGSPSDEAALHAEGASAPTADLGHLVPLTGRQLPSSDAVSTVVGEPLALEQATTANGLDMMGTWAWQIAGGQTHIEVEDVVNSRGSTTGPLRLALWATTAPVTGGSITGYDLGHCDYEALQGGYYYPVLTCNTPYNPPAAGCYYVTILLLEQVSGTWYYQDWESTGQQYGLAGGSCSGPTACTPSATAACLLGDRFKVTVSYQTVSTTGAGNVMSFGGQRTESDQSVFWWFFDPANFEMGVKMVDACVPPFNAFWVFVSGLTNQGYTVTITDTQTGRVRTYSNSLGVYPQTVGATGTTDGFPCS